VVVGDQVVEKKMVEIPKLTKLRSGQRVEEMFG